MKNEKLVYIVVLNYNGYKDTIECLKSLSKINYKNYKIVVVDNCSTDNSVENIKNYIVDNVYLLESNENLGFAGGNNIGIKFALENDAEYILLLNNDIIVDKDFLSNMIDGFKNNFDVGMISPKIYYYDNKKLINSFGARKSLYGTIKNIGQNCKDCEKFSEDLFVDYIMGCCMLIKSDVIKKVGLLEEKYFMYLEESDYCEKVNKAFKIMVKSDSHIWHKEGSSTKKSFSKINYFSLYYCRRNSLLFIEKNNNFFRKNVYFSVLLLADTIKVLKNIKDKKYRLFLKLAWKDYHLKHFGCSEYVQGLLQK